MICLKQLLTKHVLRQLIVREIFFIVCITCKHGLHTPVRGGGGDDFQQSSSAWRCNVEELRVARTNQPHKQALTLGAEKVFKL